ncbi:hypothetical protein T484DRAFT_1893920 [Baffinella frigidus]|nr:hypothetical protein T484DRAFT_1893920 [Cryptophyta sp. CCMP2293]
MVAREQRRWRTVRRRPSRLASPPPPASSPPSKMLPGAAHLSVADDADSPCRGFYDGAQAGTGVGKGKEGGRLSVSRSLDPTVRSRLKRGRDDADL